MGIMTPAPFLEFRSPVLMNVLAAFIAVFIVSEMKPLVYCLEDGLQTMPCLTAPPSPQE